MNAPEEIVAQLARLRAPFADHHISKLPKPTKAQTDAVKADFKSGIRCPVCEGWHHPKVVHLDYVGHAALTDRLLDTDIEWTWEPLALTAEGLPAFDRTGGLWIKLNVAGVTRLGYGAADGKSGGDAIKEIIGDALRNAGMRFGAALDLWHKGDLHVDNGEAGQSPDGAVSPPADTLRDQLAHSVEALIDNAEAAYTFPEGPATGITQLKTMARAIYRDVNSCTDDSELNGVLCSEETKAVLKQLAALENPAHREIWEGDGKDNPGLAGLIIRKETEFAQTMVDYVRAG